MRWRCGYMGTSHKRADIGRWSWEWEIRKVFLNFLAVEDNRRGLADCVAYGDKPCGTQRGRATSEAFFLCR